MKKKPKPRAPGPKQRAEEMRIRQISLDFVIRAAAAVASFTPKSAAELLSEASIVAKWLKEGPAQ